MTHRPIRSSVTPASASRQPPSGSRGAGRCIVAATGLVALAVLGGCSAWDPGVEIRWYTPQAHHSPAGNTGAGVRTKTSNFSPVTVGHVVGASAVSDWDHTHDRTLKGIPEGSFTKFTLIPGEYEFEYQMARGGDPLYGEIWVAGPGSRRARDFIHGTFVAVNPHGGTDGLGSGFDSVLSEDDLRRAESGDVVTKVVFVADLKAVDGRVAMIDQEIRRLLDEETRLAGQEEYWRVKLTERRRNALYYGDYGDDVPGLHLNLYQLAVGPETYHWKRYSEADDRLRTYQEKMASLRLPIERLREERTALRALLGSVTVLHRQGDLVLATPNMTRRYHDPVADITEIRRTLQGPGYGLDAPYWFSEVAHTLHWPHIFSWINIYPRLIETKNRMETHLEPIGEVLMVIKIGPRPLAKLQ
ncbi:MAG: hypothetical protein ACYSVY_13275 [Planctomycetota bacterium]